MGESSYASVAQRADTTNLDKNYRTHIGEIDPVGNKWLAKVSGAPEKLPSAEFYQAPVHQRIGNGERSNIIVLTKTDVGSTTRTWTILKV